MFSRFLWMIPNGSIPFEKPPHSNDFSARQYPVHRFSSIIFIKYIDSSNWLQQPDDTCYCSRLYIIFFRFVSPVYHKHLMCQRIFCASLIFARMKKLFVRFFSFFTQQQNEREFRCTNEFFAFQWKSWNIRLNKHVVPTRRPLDSQCYNTDQTRHRECTTRSCHPLRGFGEYLRVQQQATKRMWRE